MAAYVTGTCSYLPTLPVTPYFNHLPQAQTWLPTFPHLPQALLLGSHARHLPQAQVTSLSIWNMFILAQLRSY